MTRHTFTELYKKMMEKHEDSKPAIIYNDSTITYGQLRKKIALFKTALVTLGIKPNTKIAYSLPNCPEIFYLGYAMTEIGGCLIPMHPSTPLPFMAGILGFSQAEYLIVSSDSPLKKAPGIPCKVISIDELETVVGECDNTGIPEPGPDSLSFIISTSGTTAQPKFVPITQENFASIVNATEYLIEPMEGFGKDLTYILLFPLSTTGVVPSLSQLILGSTYVLTDDFSPPNFLSLIDKWKIDGMQGPPAYFEKLLSFPGLANYDLSSVTRFNSGSDFVPNKLFFGLKEHFKNLNQAGVGYGLAETSTMVMAWRALTAENFSQPTNILTLIDNEANEFKVVDENENELPANEKGEIYIKGKSVIGGYYNNPEATKLAFSSDGWLKTGDTGMLRDDGKVELLGRKKHTINRGGRSISPISISTLLMKLNGVNQAAVVGVPHEMYGEMIWAFIALQRGASVSEGDVNAHCRENLPPYMKPDNIIFLDELPRTRGAAKIDYDTIKQMGVDKLNQMIGENNE